MQRFIHLSYSPRFSQPFKAQFPLTATTHSTTSLQHPNASFFLPPLISFKPMSCQLLSIYTHSQRNSTVSEHECFSRVTCPPCKQGVSRSRWATTKQNRATHTERQQSPLSVFVASRAEQIAEQSAELFHSRHSLQDLARSFFTAWQCNAKWRYTRAGSIRLQA